MKYHWWCEQSKGRHASLIPHHQWFCKWHNATYCNFYVVILNHIVFSSANFVFQSNEKALFLWIKLQNRAAEVISVNSELTQDHVLQEPEKCQLENQRTSQLENWRTSPCYPCSPTLLHVLPSGMAGWNDFCSPATEIVQWFSLFLQGCHFLA